MKTNLSKLLEALERGEEVIIERAGKPVARMVKVAQQGKDRRPVGLLRQNAWIAPEFDRKDPGITKMFMEGDL